MSRYLDPKAIDKKQLARGVSIKLVMEDTGLSREQVEAINTEFHDGHI